MSSGVKKPCCTPNSDNGLVLAGISEKSGRDLASFLEHLQLTGVCVLVAIPTAYNGISSARGGRAGGGHVLHKTHVWKRHLRCHAREMVVTVGILVRVMVRVLLMICRYWLFCKGMPPIGLLERRMGLEKTDG